jgi:hypothetical protein
MPNLPIRKHSFGHSLMESIIALALLLGTHLLTLHSIDWLSAHTLSIQKQFDELIALSNQHEIRMALFINDPH